LFGFWDLPCFEQFGEGSVDEFCVSDDVTVQVVRADF